MFSASKNSSPKNFPEIPSVNFLRYLFECLPGFLTWFFRGFFLSIHEIMSEVLPDFHLNFTKIRTILPGILPWETCWFSEFSPISLEVYHEDPCGDLTSMLMLMLRTHARTSQNFFHRFSRYCSQSPLQDFPQSYSCVLPTGIVGFLPRFIPGTLQEFFSGYFSYVVAKFLLTFLSNSSGIRFCDYSRSGLRDFSQSFFRSDSLLFLLQFLHGFLRIVFTIFLQKFFSGFLPKCFAVLSWVPHVISSVRFYLVVSSIGVSPAIYFWKVLKKFLLGFHLRLLSEFLPWLLLDSRIFQDLSWTLQFLPFSSFWNFCRSYR